MAPPISYQVSCPRMLGDLHLGQIWILMVFPSFFKSSSTWVSLRMISSLDIGFEEGDGVSGTMYDFSSVRILRGKCAVS